MIATINPTELGMVKNFHYLHQKGAILMAMLQVRIL